MPNDFLDGLFGSGDDSEPRDYRDYDAGPLQGAWESAVEHSRFWDDYREDAQDTLFDQFMDRFSRGGTRDGMEEWLLMMGIEDYEFDWASWREANGY